MLLPARFTPLVASSLRYHLADLLGGESQPCMGFVYVFLGFLVKLFIASCFYMVAAETVERSHLDLFSLSQLILASRL